MAALVNFILLYSYPQSSNNNSQMSGKSQYLAQPFHIFGFDVLIDANMKAWLLEINEHPGMNAINCKGGKVCNHKTCPVSAVDLHIKKTVLNDTLEMMLSARDIGGAHNIGDRFKSLARIFPSS